MKILVLFLLAVFLSPLVSAQTNRISIIPMPNSIMPTAGDFKLDRNTAIVIKSEDERALANLLNERLQRDLGYQLKIKRSGNRNAILLSESIVDYTVAEGGYELSVERNRIRIFALEPAGRFYALQSLFQLFSSPDKGVVSIPCASIGDEPRFRYRGMHLDVGRHFMPVDFVKKYIDLMSQYKFNYFHWHLTEDQGWRIEIKKYPRLTEIGSKRPETQAGFYSTTFKGDGVPHEGFYTQEQVRDIVAYAKARFVTIIPEIEMPGHSSAALAAYPELSCKPDGKYKVQMTWGIFPEVYCPTERTFKFLEDVISEVVDLFPDSPYIHIGGDEVLKDMWKDSPDVRDLMEREHLKDLNEVQSYFVRRMERFINSKGKRIIGWNEILDGGLAPNATVMSWQGVQGGIAAARADHDVIMTPTDYTYLDYRQSNSSSEPIGQPYLLPIEKVYSFDPVPKELTAEEARHVIGGQGNVWTEYMKTPAEVEYMAFPRAIALSEVLWSYPQNKNYADFQRRLAAQLPRLDKQGVHYRKPM